MSTPTCPQCGQSRFQMTTTQQIDVQFGPAEGDSHVVDGPRGDLDWEDKTMAICCNCGHSDELGRMTCAMRRVRVNVDETIEQTTLIELDVPEYLMVDTDTDEFEEHVKAVYQSGSGFKTIHNRINDVTRCTASFAALAPQEPDHA